MIIRRILRPFCTLLLLGTLGCNDEGTSVRGTVTYEGQLVERGVITLTPTDGSGKPEGSKVLHGEFHIGSIEPGDKQISVIGGVGSESEQAAPATSEGKVKSMIQAGQQTELIPTNAVGNGQTVIVQEGPQEIEVILLRPAND